MGSAIIVGAGPAGASLGYTLARRGVTVTLLERHDELDREFRGEWLSASGRLALRQMGVGDAIDAVPQLETGGATIFIGGRERFTVRPGKESNPDEDFLLVPQPALLREIIKLAEDNPSFTFLNKVVVRDVVRQNGRVVGVTGTRDGEPFEQRADLVIACDGRASLLRRASGLPVSEKTDQAFDMLWFKASTPPGLDPSLGYQFLQRNGTAFCHPHPDGLQQYGWAFPKGTYGELRQRGRDAWVDAMCQHVPEVFAAHLSSIREEIDAAFLELVCYHLDDWYVPGLLLIGDAAHPMSAVGGQGINMALRDAVVTANHLGPLLLAESPSSDAVDTEAPKVATERLPEIKKIQHMQAKGSKILNLESAPARIMIERIVPLLGKKAAPILAKGVGTTKTFRHGVTKVDLTF
jgi:2-polyprenyl-6-methoxyphenol hydroxylase-like FAD-dependent oxidoreductase